MGVSNRLGGDGGFTLVEMMVALGIAAILFALAIPSFIRVIQTARVDADASLLLNAVQFARGEAIKRGVSVSVAAPNAWSSGLTVFVDTNENLIVDAGEKVVARFDSPKELRATGVGALLDGAMFDGLGRSAPNPLNAGYNKTGGHLALSASDSKVWATLCVGSTGRARVFRPIVPSTTDPGC